MSRLLTNLMLKNQHLNVVLSVAAIALVAGCSTESAPPISASPESPSTASQPLFNNPKPVQKNNKPLVVPPDNPTASTNSQIQQYINRLAAKGFLKQYQGVWIQSGDALLANYQGTVPLPAASLTKVATSLAALQTFGPNHQFITQIQTTGSIRNGVLEGDLIIRGGEDPFFVWEDAVTVGNLLNQLGIQRVNGNLVIADEFYMNFEANPQTAGNFIKQGLNYRLWPAEAEAQYWTLPPGTPRPLVAIDGSVRVLSFIPTNVRPLIKHESLPLIELLKRMNRYSNNPMADMLADSVGGAGVVARKAAAAAGVSVAEIQLINGSGLGLENRISPRAAVGMFLAIERYLQPYNLTVADAFTVVGRDEGILDPRPLPRLSVVKSGTLNNVSALAGALPTREQGTVWFAIANIGGDLAGFRAEQEALLQQFVNQWGAVQSLPVELTPNFSTKNLASRTKITWESQ